jgi:uncharacterized membrane protein
MNDQQPVAPQNNDAESWIQPGQKNAQLVYILYLVGLMLGFTGIVGLVMACMNRGNSEDWIDSHYTYAIRTFWIGIVYCIISFLTSFIVIGIFLAIATAVWFIIRCVKGLQVITRKEPIANVETWLI